MEQMMKEMTPKILFGLLTIYKTMQTNNRKKFSQTNR